MNKISNEIYRNFSPLPEDLSGWGGDCEIFEKLIEKYKPSTIIELGSWKGQSTVNMAKAMQKYNINNPKIYAVDTWLGSVEFWTFLSESSERDLMLKNGYPQIYYQFISNMIRNNLQEIVLPLPNTSTAGLKILKHLNIIPNMIYIDASHETEDVYTDLKLSYDMMENGIIFGDDHEWQSVMKALLQFARENKLQFIIDDRFWIFEKK